MKKYLAMKMQIGSYVDVLKTVGGIMVAYHLYQKVKYSNTDINAHNSI